MQSIFTRSSVAAFAYFVLIPGYFVYHAAVGKGLISNFLGGYSTAASLLCMPMLIFLYSKKLCASINDRSALDVFFCLYVILYAFVLALALAHSRNLENVISQIGVIPQFMTLFMLARTVPLTNHIFHRFNFTALILISATILFNSSTGEFVIAVYDVVSREDVEKFASYQAYALIYIIMVTIAIGHTSSYKSRLLIYTIAIPTLFLNGARTEFLGLVIVIFFVELLRSKRKALMFSTLLFVLFIFILFIIYLEEYLPYNRVLLLVLQRNEDQSLNDRTEVLNSGLSTIAAHPILGSFGNYPPGQYIHNALSAWVDFGVIGFLWFIFLIAIPTINLLMQRKYSDATPNWSIAIIFALLSLLFALISKHHSYQLLPFMLGIYIQYQCSRPQLGVAR